MAVQLWDKNKKKKNQDKLRGGGGGSNVVDYIRATLCK